MPAVSVLEAQELILDTYNVYSKSLRLSKDNPSTLFFYAIDVKFGVRGLKTSIIIRRDLFDFSNRSMQLAHDRLLDLNGWIAGIHFTFGRQNIE